LDTKNGRLKDTALTTNQRLGRHRHAEWATSGFTSADFPESRTLAEELAPDLRYAGVPTELYTARGTAFWDEFAEITRVAIRAAREPDRLISG
jgi:hypothetical protein